MRRTDTPQSAEFLHDQKEVHSVSPVEVESDVRDNGDNLTLKAVQELLQLGLIPRHSNIEPVHPIVHYLPLCGPVVCLRSGQTLYQEHPSSAWLRLI